jgi:hypothetical protein
VKKHSGREEAERKTNLRSCVSPSSAYVVLKAGLRLAKLASDMDIRKSCIGRHCIKSRKLMASRSLFSCEPDEFIFGKMDLEGNFVEKFRLR